jgi:hypothetical protein
MNKKCPNCRLTNYSGLQVCARCEADLTELRVDSESPPKRRSALLSRALVCVAVCVAVTLGFYISLIASAGSLTIEEKSTVRAAIRELKAKGFTDEVFLLEHITVFRATDNWLNASVAKENAYAATNFPFEIITLYPDFFTYPVDDTERAAILLHEARHLKGKDEADAYRFVWEHRRQLGWTQEKYYNSPVWANVRKQTRDTVPELFACDASQKGDCDE